MKNGEAPETLRRFFMLARLAWRAAIYF